MLDPFLIVGCAVGLVIADAGFALYRRQRACVAVVSPPVVLPEETLRTLREQQVEIARLRAAGVVNASNSALAPSPWTDVGAMIAAMQARQVDQLAYGAQRNVYGAENYIALQQRKFSPPESYVVVNAQTGEAESLWNTKAEAIQQASTLNSRGGVWAIQPYRQSSAAWSS